MCKYFQVVYEFHSRDGESDENTARAYYEDSQNARIKPIWLRLADLFTENEGNKHLTLLKIYLADLCHFAPNGIGSTRTISQKIGRWRDIREKVARQMLLEEIKVVKPKLIVCQGRDSFETLKTLLQPTLHEPFPVETDYKRPKQYAMKLARLSDGTRIMGLPHLGSSHNMVNTFWKKNLEKVREELKARGFLPV